MLAHQTPSSTLPPRATNKGYTHIYFGENQLSPGSLCMLPLTTSHLNPLLLIRVRASPYLSPSPVLSWVRPMHRRKNPPVYSSKGTTSPGQNPRNPSKKFKKKMQK